MQVLLPCPVCGTYCGHLHIHAHACTHTCIRICTRMCTLMHMHTHTHTHAHTHARARTHTHARARAHTHTHTHTPTHTQTHAHIHTSPMTFCLATTTAFASSVLIPELSWPSTSVSSYDGVWIGLGTDIILTPTQPHPATHSHTTYTSLMLDLFSPLVFVRGSLFSRV